MRPLLASLLLLLFAGNVHGQITITGADMPIHGDTLRFSNASPVNMMFVAADSGAGMSWDYILEPTSQGLDEYKKPAEVNMLFGFTIGYPNSYGPKIADSIPGIGLVMPGITVSNLHTFYSRFTTPQCYVALAFGAIISGFPVGADYTKPDYIYRFPLNYNNTDSNDFYLDYGLATLGSIKQSGYRKNRVDGWGTITTPYFTTPQNCIRVRSEIVETDSVTLDTLSFSIPRTTVEYKWLVNGEHYPALWVTAMSFGGVEVVTSVRYKDIYRPELNNTSVGNVTTNADDVFVYPNPATGGTVTFELPNSWTNFAIELFDVQGKTITAVSNTRKLDMSALPKGNYVARVSSGINYAYLKITR